MVRQQRGRKKCAVPEVIRKICQIADEIRRHNSRAEVQCVRKGGWVLLEQLFVPGFRDPLMILFVADWRGRLTDIDNGSGGSARVVG